MDYLVIKQWIIIVWSTITCIGSVYSNAIRRELDFLLTQDSIEYYGVSPLMDEYAIIHVENSYSSRTRRASAYSSDKQTEIILEAFGEAYRIRLRPNKVLVPGRGLFAKFTDKNGAVTKRKHIQSGCHFVGNVISHEHGNKTLSALTLCDGISGVVATGESTMYIKPLREDHSREYQRRTRQENNVQYRPHLVFRRDASDETSPGEEQEENEDYFCGLDEEHFHRDHNFPIDSDEGSHEEPSRKKRENVEKILEVMVTIGSDMAELHGEEEALEVALGVLNVAASRFQDESIGPNPLFFHVVEIIVLTGSVTAHPGGKLNLTDDGEDTLLSFCVYQNVKNPTSDDDRGHWDLAILLTRTDMELNGNPALIGIAMSSGTCELPRQCLLCEEYGPSTGLVLAHEIGHTLGMNHDGSPLSQSCLNGKNLMASSRVTGAEAFKWSQCSRSSYSSFISQRSCLDDGPVDNVLDITNELGDKYSADEQCRLYSPTTPCACVESQLNDLGRTLSDICGALHCVELGVCKQIQLPAADGTSCGNNGEVCFAGVCSPGLPVNSPPSEPVNGSWSEWRSSCCSRTCGGTGVEMLKRRCNNPAPAFGGLPCLGKDTDFRLCHTEPCTGGHASDRNGQCMALFGPGVIALTTDGSGDKLCQMNCINQALGTTHGNGFYASGTQCGGEFDVCVNGKCEAFGCDGVHNSMVSMDRCDVCGGDGQTCRNAGTYTNGFPGDYITAIIFEDGTADINITSRNPSTSIGLAAGNTRIIDGRDQIIGHTRELLYFGNDIQYMKTPDVESITVLGPTNLRLSLIVHVPDSTSVINALPNVDYVYYSRVVIPVFNYRWRVTPGECSCTASYAMNQISCILVETNSEEPAEKCDALTKPSLYITCDPNRRECIQEEIVRTEWFYSSYGDCNATCGSDSYRSRTAECVSPDTQPPSVLPAGSCSSLETPILYEMCVLPACHRYEWSTGAWEPCPVTCGFGLQFRVVRCENVSEPSAGFTTVADSYCSSEKPIIYQICGTCPCNIVCPADRRIDYNSCSCVCPSIPCPEGQILDSNSCRCVCSSVSVCPDGQVFNFNTCNCECEQQVCESPSTFNEETCGCEDNCNTEIVGESPNDLTGFLVTLSLEDIYTSLCTVTLQAPIDYSIELQVIWLNLNPTDELLIVLGDGILPEVWTSIETLGSTLRRYSTNKVVIGRIVRQPGHGYIIKYEMIPS